MKLIKNEDHVLFKNLDGEYHLTLESFEKLGEYEAIKLAKSEIEKKRTRHFTGDKINFSRARALGFCEFGIKDFCKMLGIDSSKTYGVEYLKEILTIEVINSYQEECLKVFGASMLDNFGGPINYLRETRDYNLILRTEFIKSKDLHLLACLFAEYSLENFEKNHPDDDRPRKAIDAKRKWVNGEISDNDLAAAWSAARYAARSAARSAGSAARSAAWYAAGYAARSAAWYAAESAARSAAWYAAGYAAESARSAAEYAAIDYFIDEIIKVLESYNVSV